MQGNISTVFVNLQMLLFYFVNKFNAITCGATDLIGVKSAVKWHKKVHSRPLEVAMGTRFDGKLL